jgi:HSP20 family molecular chaperone IbpA
VDTDGIKARYENGVLMLTLPKKQETIPEKKQLEIE